MGAPGQGKCDRCHLQRTIRTPKGGVRQFNLCRDCRYTMTNEEIQQWSTTPCDPDVFAETYEEVTS